MSPYVATVQPFNVKSGIRMGSSGVRILCACATFTAEDAALSFRLLPVPPSVTIQSTASQWNVRRKEEKRNLPEATAYNGAIGSKPAKIASQKVHQGDCTVKGTKEGLAVTQLALAPPTKKCNRTTVQSIGQALTLGFFLLRVDSLGCSAAAMLLS